MFTRLANGVGDRLIEAGESPRIARIAANREYLSHVVALTFFESLFLIVVEHVKLVTFLTIRDFSRDSRAFFCVFVI